MIQLKDGVLVAGNKYVNEMFRALETAFDEQGLDVIITAGKDGKHMVGSYHEQARALDVRSREVLNKSAMVKRLQALLPAYYDVVFEPELVKDGKVIRGEHFHLEADKKKEVRA